MIKVNVADAKAKLSEYLDRAVSGERIVICRHNKPVAELRAFEETRVEPRPIGPLPGYPTFEISDAFFEPLPDDELDLWDGGPADTDEPTARDTQETGRIPERAAPLRVGRSRARKRRR